MLIHIIDDTISINMEPGLLVIKTFQIFKALHILDTTYVLCILSIIYYLSFMSNMRYFLLYLYWQIFKGLYYRAFTLYINAPRGEGKYSPAPLKFLYDWTNKYNNVQSKMSSTIYNHENFQRSPNYDTIYIKHRQCCKQSIVMNDRTCLLIANTLL